MGHSFSSAEMRPLRSCTMPSFVVDPAPVVDRLEPVRAGNKNNQQRAARVIFKLTPHVMVQVKCKGKMEMYFVVVLADQ